MHPQGNGNGDDDGRNLSANLGIFRNGYNALGNDEISRNIPKGYDCLY